MLCMCAICPHDHDDENLCHPTPHTIPCSDVLQRPPPSPLCLLFPTRFLALTASLGALLCAPGIINGYLFIYLSLLFAALMKDLMVLIQQMWSFDIMDRVCMCRPAFSNQHAKLILHGFPSTINDAK